MKALAARFLPDRALQVVERSFSRSCRVLTCLALLCAPLSDQRTGERNEDDIFLAWLRAPIGQPASGKRRRRRRRLRPVRAETDRGRSLAAVRADLHDGPAQYLAYALMYLDELAPSAVLDKDPRHETYQRIRSALVAALDETRAIASGTSLASLRPLDPMRVIAQAIKSHEAQTRTTVTHTIGRLPAKLAQAAKICLYRFTQEGLNNAYRHARGQGQRLTVEIAGSEILAEVADDGPGFDDARAWSSGTGLPSLRQRAESAGGRLDLVHEPGRGTRLKLRLPATSPATRESHDV